MKIGIAGGGAFGTALGVALALDGNDIALWARDDHAVAQMRKARANPKLPGVSLPETMTFGSDLGILSDRQINLIAIPAQTLPDFLTAQQAQFDGKYIVACCKGIDLTRMTGPASTIKAVLPDSTAAVLTGPSFAADIARGLPTALTLACADEQQGAILQTALSTTALRLYRTTDIVGAELGGALKNVIAIAAGVTIGAGLGESARAAILTRGFPEMKRLAQALGADPETLNGLSGFGDLVLTCTSDQSRNYRYGMALGRGESFDTATTVEGAATAKAVQKLANTLQIDLPICSVVAKLIAQETTVSDALNALLSRPLKEE